MSTAGGASPRLAGFVAAVLAGGKGKRMGMNKALLEIDGRKVLDRIVDALQEVFPLILVVTQKDDPVLQAAARPGVKAVSDAFPGKGPLVGIYTALQHSPAPYIFVMACDMPYPNLDLVRCMMREAEGREAVVPRRGDYIEPLFAVYRRDVRDKIRARLERESLKVYRLISELDVRFLEEEEIAACDPDFRSFFNINTPDDLRSLP